MLINSKLYHKNKGVPTIYVYKPSALQQISTLHNLIYIYISSHDPLFMPTMGAQAEEYQTLHMSEVLSSEAEKSTTLTDEEAQPNLEEVEKIIGYSFNNKVLLKEAFTHSSFLSTERSASSYERLEYVGDAVLNLLFSREQYNLYPDLPPGRLTRLRAANVDTEKLARVAIKHGLHRYLRHKKPLLEEQVSDDRVKA